MATQADAVAAHAAASTSGSPGPEVAYAVDLFVVHAAADAEFVHGYLVPALNLPPSRLLLIDDVPAAKNAAETVAETVAEIDRRVASSRFPPPPPRLLLMDDAPAAKPAAETVAETVAEIDRRVTSSRFTAAVLSPAYLADRWAQFGGRLATALRIDGTRSR